MYLQPLASHRLWSWTTGLGLMIAGLFTTTPALAAEQVVMKYHVIERSVSVEALTTFAETGEMSSALEYYFDASGQKPERIRRFLTREVEFGVVPLDQILNSFMGDTMLDQVSNYIHTPSDRANREAMRSALVLSASDDNRVSLLEVIQKYPTQEVHVDGDRIVTAYRQIQGFGDYIADILNEIDVPLF
ncbi:MAG: hypothetical protein Kow00121_00110 [Elainellaceae cyanobacterium]